MPGDERDGTRRTEADAATAADGPGSPPARPAAAPQVHAVSAADAGNATGTVTTDAPVGPDGPPLEPPLEEVESAVAAAIAAEARQRSGQDAEPVEPAARTPESERFEIPALEATNDMSAALDQNVDLLRDVELNVKIELGRCRMLVDDVLRLGEGSVVELDKLAGDPVDVFVNDRLVARGEVLVLNDSFCVRIGDIVREDVREETPVS